MHRISSRSAFLRALLCALVLLLALAPISGAAAATADEVDATATESVTDTEAASVTAAPTAEATSTESAEVTATQNDTTQVEAAAPGSGGSANQDGPYTPDPTASPTPSGNGSGKTPHDAGSKGNADGKNPPGQMPGPDADGDNGYECDGNNGVAKGNPAHTQCPPPAPSITIIKAHTITPLVDPQTIAQGGTATWQIRVTNTGNVTLTNVTVTDPLATDCNRNLGTLAPGASAAVYSCSKAAVPASFTNVANVVGTHLNGTVNASDTAPVTVTTVTPAPAITIVKAYTLNPLVDGQTIPLNGTATWMMRVTNTGNTVLNNVTVNDPLASGCNRTLGTLAAGASTEYACSLGAVPASFTNRADVTGTSPQGTQVTAYDTAPVTVFDTPGGNPPSIQLVKTAPTPDCPRPGQSVAYQFEIRNNGAQTLSNIALNDPLLGGAVTLPQTTLAPGQSMQATKSYTLTAANIAAGTLNNTATVTSTAAANQSVNNTANAVLILEDCPGKIRLDKTGPATARVGDQITYTFTVTNTGSVTLSDVRITDQRLGVFGLPVNPATLTPGQQGTATATYSVTEADADAAEILNIAFVRARTPDNTEVEDEDDHRTTVPRTPEAPRPRIRLVKDGPAKAGVGETITYRFTVTNTGNVTLTNVNITDPLLGLDRLTVRPSTLAPDEQGTATATYVVTEADADAGSIYNTAVARGTAPDGRTVRDRDDHTVTVPLVPPAPPVCVSPPCGPPPPPPPPPELPATGVGTTGFALTALLSLALGGVLLGIAGSGNLQAAMANATVNADSPLLAMLRQWNLAPKPGGAQARRRRRR